MLALDSVFGQAALYTTIILILVGTLWVIWPR